MDFGPGKREWTFTVICFQAIRAILPGEELFFTYSAYAQERFGLA